MPELVFFRRGEEVLRLSLGDERVVLGRGDRCDVVIPDPEVSRQHVALHLEDGRCVLQDLSGKGTEVAGKRITHGDVPDGGDISLGQWRAIFRATGRGDDAMATELGPRTELLASAEATDSPKLPAQVRLRTNGQETTHKLQTESFTAGKDAGNDLVLNQRFVSSRHLKVTRHHNRFTVSDQRSTNGTWINNVRIFEADVPFYTTLRVGEGELIIEPALSKVTAPIETGTYGLIGVDQSIKSLIELIDRVAPSMAAVAIFGESGTGKELVARAIHSQSNRAENTFIPVNCAAISKELIESELFGHEKGSFTGATNARKGAFEEADGGTIFLDEIGELPLDLQAKLLRALESGEIKRVGAPRPTTVDTRVVAATNRDLLAMAREGKFREDLYYRLCVIPLSLPPLRSRPGDIRLIAEHFVRTYAPRGQRVVLLPAAVAALESHPWPGNIRELRNVIHRALLLRRGPNIDAGDLKFDAVPDRPMVSASGGLEHQPGMSLEAQLQRAERLIVESAIKRLQGNKEAAARELVVSRSTLFKRLKEWGLTSNDE
ncbi:MAG: sigma-54-dependent Fis family transcriptional regulator [Archangium gephyra]|uniref:Sigma-54-dependent Fis family transcriptional regulator n=1 Tax=Archangium gephyra TaxID=48 RepID=A0A2W5SZH8_9BACT|nr:MAG: sigma-54-dependent Fis family transcriptional regulator [Archangium gephyra]